MTGDLDLSFIVGVPTPAAELLFAEQPTLADAVTAITGSLPEATVRLSTTSISVGHTDLMYDLNDARMCPMTLVGPVRQASTQGLEALAASSWGGARAALDDARLSLWIVTGAAMPQRGACDRDRTTTLKA